jgi:pyruvate/2-oxoglutarate dehydrogenase complex dihydrolipoamide dehydrogenase (E3) component
MLTTSPPEAVKPATSERDVIAADLCILGAGPGGIALAASAAAYGQKVVLVEKHKMGGTSLNYGSMPAKALLASAGRAHAIRSAGPFGVTPFEPVVDRAAVQRQIGEIVATCTPNAAVERLAGLGVRVIQAAGRFVDAKTLAAGEHRIAARRFVLATGSSPFVPDLPGLDAITYFTTETIVREPGPIDHLVVMGGGAAGVELAQSHRRLGSRVTLIEAQSTVLHRCDPELAAVVRTRLVAEGIVILESSKVVSVEGGQGRVRVEVEAGNSRSRIEGTHLLIACGRRPAIDGIGLDAARIAVTAEGVKVNRFLRTTNRRVFAIGDVTGLPQSANRAEYHAGLLVKTLLFRSPAKADPRLIPAQIHTDPEFASVGLSEAEARAAYSSIQVLRWPMRENARALADRDPTGHIKVIADRRGRILGAAIVARAAGELIAIWSLAISKQMSLDDMNGWVASYPSLGEASRQVAGTGAGSVAGQAVSRGWVKLLTRLGL